MDNDIITDEYDREIDAWEAWADVSATIERDGYLTGSTCG